MKYKINSFLLFGIVLGITGIALLIVNSFSNVQNQECEITDLSFEYYNCSKIENVSTNNVSTNNVSTNNVSTNVARACTSLCTDCIIHYLYNNHSETKTYHCYENANCIEKWVKFAEKKNHMCYKYENKIYWGYFHNYDVNMIYASFALIITSFVIISTVSYRLCRKPKTNEELQYLL
jgi:hypothetical protein